MKADQATPPPSASATPAIASRRLVAAVLSALLLPVLVFYGLLARDTVNIPVLDDYNGVLEYLEHFSQLSTRGAKWAYVLTAQHNEYKTVFANLIIALQYILSGHPNFALLSWLGNIFILPLFYLLWRHFLTAEEDIVARLTLFLPVSFLLFQLQYYETLDWSMPGLQNVPIFAFALASLSSLTRQQSRSFMAACVFLVLSIATTGNGFALVPIGALLLLHRKQSTRAAVWVGVGVLCAAGYFYHYNFQSSQQDRHGSVLNSVHFLNPLFMLSFMGSAAGNPHYLLRYVCILLGAAIVAILLWMVRSHYVDTNPAILCFTVFLTLTAFGVSGLRSKLGFYSSQSSRYKIYSDLLLICCYTFLVDRYRRQGAPRFRRYFLLALIASGLFCVVFDVANGERLSTRRWQVVQGAAAYDRTHHQEGPVMIYGSERTPAALEINHWVQPIMQESEATGLYRLP